MHGSCLPLAEVSPGLCCPGWAPSPSRGGRRSPWYQQPALGESPNQAMGKRSSQLGLSEGTTRVGPPCPASPSVTPLPGRASQPGCQPPPCEVPSPRRLSPFAPLPRSLGARRGKRPGPTPALPPALVQDPRLISLDPQAPPRHRHSPPLPQTESPLALSGLGLPQIPAISTTDRLPLCSC